MILFLFPSVLSHMGRGAWTDWGCHVNFEHGFGTGLPRSCRPYLIGKTEHSGTKERVARFFAGRTLLGSKRKFLPLLLRHS